MIGFSTGIRALLANQYALQVAANNIANANTQGYSRQEVIFQNTRPERVGSFLVGTGVEVGAINRVVDDLLDSRIRQQLQYVGYLDAKERQLTGLEDIFGSMNAGSMSTLMGNFFNEISSLATSPQDTTLRSGMLSSGDSLARNLNQLSNQFESVQESIQTELGFTVEQINYLSDSISQLNLQISAATVQGLKPSGLMDQRELMLKELSSLIDIYTLKDDRGNISVTTGGIPIVTEGRNQALEVKQGVPAKIIIAGTTQQIFVTNGKIKGLLAAANEILPEYQSKLDTLSHELIFNFNKVHAMGVGLDGPMSTMNGTVSLKDSVGGGGWRNTVLSLAGLSFPPKKGSVFVSITEEETGEIIRYELDVNPDNQSIEDVAALFSDVPHLQADVDTTGRLRIQAEQGYKFDFSPRLDPNPDKIGAFGGGSATIGGNRGEPFQLTDGDAITIAVDGGAPQTVTINGSDFARLNAATAEELAAVINRDTTGVTASAVGGRLVLQSVNTGVSSSLQIQDVGAGSLTTLLGLSTALETGSEQSVQVDISGDYKGDGNEKLFFVAKGSGIIGTTEGLVIEVYNEKGAQVALLDVGNNYTPGEKIDVWEGIEITLSEGEINETSGEFFTLDALEDTDEANLLPALGLNSFFEGDSAGNIKVREALLENPGKFAASLNADIGDNANILALLALQDKRLSELGSATYEGYFQSVEGGLGFETARTQQLYNGQEAILNNMLTQREAISGVSVDEEYLKLIQYQRSFEAASRFIDVMNQVMDIIVHLGE